MPSATHQIEVKVRDIHQLFNSMDPSPFHERDLDHDAEQFIVGWAQEFPKDARVKLIVHLSVNAPDFPDPQPAIQESLRNYFDYRADMTRREFRQLMREGRGALLIGLAFLILCQASALLLPGREPGPMFIREGLTIVGWVAMWKPLDIYLYRWWPLLGLWRVFRGLREMDVEVRLPGKWDSYGI